MNQNRWPAPVPHHTHRQYCNHRYPHCRLCRLLSLQTKTSRWGHNGRQKTRLSPLHPLALNAPAGYFKNFPKDTLTSKNVLAWMQCTFHFFSWTQGRRCSISWHRTAATRLYDPGQKNQCGWRIHLLSTFRGFSMGFSTWGFKFVGTWKMIDLVRRGNGHAYYVQH